MAKRHFLIILSLTTALVVALFAVPMAFILYVDPLEVLYKHEGKQKYFFYDTAYRDAGLIKRHLEYYKDKKNILIGSSLFMNTLEHDMARYAGMEQSLSLCVSGLRPRELGLIYSNVIDKEPVENIIIGLDTWYYLSEFGTPQNRLIAALYNGTFLDRLKASARYEVVDMAVRILRGTEPERNNEAMLSFMADACQTQSFSRFSSEKHKVLAAEAQARAEALQPPAQAGVHVAGLDALIPLLLATPERIKVHMLIPPVFFGGENAGVFQFYHAGILRLVRELQSRPNVFLYGFDDVPAITNNVANYYDSHHYGIGVNRYMLKAIGQRKHVLTPETAPGYLERVWQNRKYGQAYYDTAHTASFEGPLDEEAFSRYPDFPIGPEPLPLPD